MTTTPFDAARLRGIFPFLPQGADAGLWQRWQNEIGMLLHEHPVNEARRGRGQRAGDRHLVLGRGAPRGHQRDAARHRPCSARTNRRPCARHRASRGWNQPPARIGRHAGARARRRRSTQRRFCAGAHGGHRHDRAGRRAGRPSRALARARARMSRRKRLARLTLIADGHGVAARWTATTADVLATRFRSRAAQAVRRPCADPNRDHRSPRSRPRHRHRCKPPAGRRCLRAFTLRAASSTRPSSTIRWPRCRPSRHSRTSTPRPSASRTPSPRGERIVHRRRLRRRRRDGVRGRRARPARDGRRRRLPRAQPLRVRLRTDAGDRRARRGAAARLLVTVDNGIASVDGVAAAQRAAAST